MTPTAPEGWRDHGEDAGRPLQELRTKGLLWLINRQVFHPRGFALGVIADIETGEISGWELLGNGHAPWTFADGEESTALAAVEAFFDEHREPTPNASTELLERIRTRHYRTAGGLCHGDGATYPCATAYEIDQLLTKENR